MLGLIALGGECTYTGRMRQLCSTTRYIVAADGGMKHLDVLGIKPDTLVGDMDSISGDLLLAAQDDPSIEVVEFSTRKNMTDSEIAVQTALSHGCDRLLFIGASGNRPDHVLANQMMAASIADRGIPCILTDGITFIYTITAGNSPFSYPLEDLQADSDVISIIPVKGDISNLSIHNLEYPLDKQLVNFGSTRAVSNAIHKNSSCGEEYASVSLDSGVVFFIHTPKDNS